MLFFFPEYTGQIFGECYLSFESQFFWPKMNKLIKYDDGFPMCKRACSSYFISCFGKLSSFEGLLTQMV